MNIVALRGFLVEDKPDVISKVFRDGLKVYSLNKAHNASQQVFNTVRAIDFVLYRELEPVFQKEPVCFIDPKLRGLAASIYIRKGQAFSSDERMTRIFAHAVAAGNAIARAISFHSPTPLPCCKGWFPLLRLFGPLDARFDKKGNRVR
ncbi:DUF1254 domain-containing protein [Serratia fonticola]|uniref:hypothetical protein n=1 Tax=Serratia fonticola TaxID=47917 RepID=UPI0021BB9608|nr:hypothetical protein [Serratia fonticola]